jgi:hypothetical protein
MLRQWKLISIVTDALLGQQWELSVCVSIVMHGCLHFTQQWGQHDFQGN